MNSRFKGHIRLIALLLVFVILSGCSFGGKTKIKQVKKTQTFIDNYPGEDPVYETETIYDYYDDEYTTSPGKWSTTRGGQRTIQNLSNYAFNEDDYENVSYGGGTDVRQENFNRGIGISSYHATEGWNPSTATKAIDSANMREMNITSRRTWGESSQGVLSSDFDYAGSVSVASILDHTVYSNGANSTTNYVFADPNGVQKIFDSWKERFVNPLVRAQNRAILIGNEYRTLFKNHSKNGSYELSGYDDITLNGFRNWCKTRFGTVENLNKLCSTSFAGFSAVYPVKQNGTKIMYEFYLYNRQTFRDLFKQVIAKMKAIYPETKWGYAGYRSNTGAYNDNLYLDYLDYTSQNFYFGNLYMSDFHEWSFGMDNLAAWSKTAPVLVTEVGWHNGKSTDEEQAVVARKYKQGLNMFYMRPRYAGTYVFNYADGAGADVEEGSATWGVVDGYRNKRQSFYSIAQVYTDFKYLDKFYTGASNTPLVAISNLAVDEEYAGAANISRKMAGVLYSQGVPVQVVPSDDASRFDSLKEKLLIYNDLTIYQNPDGSGDVGKALEQYMKKGNKVLRTVSTAPTSLYGKGNALIASSASALEKKYSNFTCAETAAADKDNMWAFLSKHIHGDFVSGKVKVDKGKINENAVRILEVDAVSGNTIKDPTWELETKMVYKNGEMYLALVNISDKPIDRVEVTLGVNNGVMLNLTPRILRGDSNVSAYRPERANIPSYVKSADDSKVSFGTVTVENLDTYAYIYVGRAVIK